MKSPVSVDIDLEKQGAHFGYLSVPYSYDLSGWSKLKVPIACFANGEGPTVLIMAGNHGDEYTGQIALMRLMREMPLHEVVGRLIVVPVLNIPASRSATRLSPLDGMNFNRCFPGNPDGTPSEALADYLTRFLFPISDAVVDLHTGGRGAYFFPCAHMHLVGDLEQRRRMAAATAAFNTDFAFVYRDVAGSGLLPVEAERQGKTVVSTEMGGGEVVFPSIHRICRNGVWNLLSHLGALGREQIYREDLGLAETRWVQALDEEDYLFCPESGVVEVLAEAGEPIDLGQAVAALHFPETPMREPIMIESNTRGVLIAHRGPALTRQGDFVACVAHEVSQEIRTTLF